MRGRNEAEGKGKEKVLDDAPRMLTLGYDSANSLDSEFGIPSIYLHGVR